MKAVTKKYTKKIALYCQEEIPDGMGGYKAELVKKCTIWANFLRPKFTPKTMQGDGSNVEITQGISIRPITEVKKDWLIKYKNSVYKILHVDSSTQGEVILTTTEVKKCLDT